MFLRTIQRRDYELLYSLLAGSDSGDTWRYRGATPSPEEFERDLWRDVLVQYLVIRRSPRRPIGIVSGYHSNLRNQTVYVSMVAFPAFRGSGLLFQGLERLVDHLFANWNIRKVYVEIPSFNLPQFRSAIGTLVSEEGRLKDYEYYGNAYHDVILGSMHRDSWMTAKATFRALAVTRAQVITEPGVVGLPYQPDAFCHAVADLVTEITGATVSSVSLETLLHGDLALDSLEMLQVLDVATAMMPLEPEEEESLWRSGARVRDLYHLYLRALQMPPLSAEGEPLD